MTSYDNQGVPKRCGTSGSIRVNQNHQNQTFRHELAGGYLWSPKRNTNGARNLLVDDDRRRAIVQRVRVGLPVTRQKQLRERREGLVDEPLRFRRDRVEDQRALPAALDAGEHGDLSTWNVERDVLEIVLACATHFNVAERRAH